MRQRMVEAAVPGVLLALTAGFTWSSVEGLSGSIANAARREQLQMARLELQRASATEAALARDVSGLRSVVLDRDLLDTEARRLGLARADELIIPLHEEGAGSQPPAPSRLSSAPRHSR